MFFTWIIINALWVKGRISILKCLLTILSLSKEKICSAISGIIIVNDFWAYLFVVVVVYSEILSINTFIIITGTM